VNRVHLADCRALNRLLHYIKGVSTCIIRVVLVNVCGGNILQLPNCLKLRVVSVA
jgi:hypothetical protein